MNFQQKLDTIIEKNNSLVCVGLDTDLNKIPEHIKTSDHPQFTFNKAIIDATHEFVCAYKPNSAFYESYGAKGIEELKMTFDYIHTQYPEIVTVLDAKRADIGNTNKGYATFIFDYLQADAVTLQPYLGGEAIKPFLERADKGCIILCRTSNKGAGEFQDMLVITNSSEATSVSSLNATEESSLRHPELVSGSQGNSGSESGMTMYKYVAQQVSQKWNTNNNCLLVVGATYPEEMTEIRKIVGDMTFLVPGIGAQGGDIEKTVKAGLNSKKAGMIISSSRGIIFASSGEDFAQRAGEETKKLREEINKYR